MTDSERIRVEAQLLQLERLLVDALAAIGALRRIVKHDA